MGHPQVLWGVEHAITAMVLLNTWLENGHQMTGHFPRGSGELIKAGVRTGSKPEDLLTLIGWRARREGPQERT